MNQINNNFRLYGKVASATRGQWSYHHAGVYLSYRNSKGKTVSTKLFAMRNEYRSKRKAEADIPAILRDNAAYDAAVNAAINEVTTAPNKVYKVVEVKNGTFRSLYDDHIVYHMGELHAHPMIEQLHVGLWVHTTLEGAQTYRDKIAAKYPDAKFVIVECDASSLHEVNGKHCVAALIPREIVG